MDFFKKNVDSQFLVRIIRNEVGAEEREFFEKWLEESDDNKEEYSSLVLLWDKFQFSNLPALPSKKDQWEKIEKAISHPAEPYPKPASLSFPNYKTPVPEKNLKRRDDKLIWIYRIAAVILISFAVFFGLVSRREIPTETVLTNPQTNIVNIKYYTLSTAKGEKATLSLSDGSVIQLNSESRLIYPNYFDTDSREVEFEGEGYFKISKDASRPFRVNCNNTVTEVTGTEFNIRNRKNDISITVVEGSVKTFSNNEAAGVSVTKGEMITLKPSGNFSKPVKVNLEHSTAWRKNKIAFSRTPLRLAAEELERCYSNVEIIIVSDSLKQKTITGLFDTNSIDDILSIFSLTMDIKISKNGNKIYFE